MPDTSAQGQFIWRDLTTSDPDKAEAFYTQLFGWTVVHQETRRESGGSVTYRVISNAGTEMGGIMGTADAGLSPDQVPSHWLSHIYVTDVDAIAARARELGGVVHSEPQDIPGVGRFAVIADPQGGMFSALSVLMPNPGNDPTADVPLGGVVWNELLTGDIDGAIAFYTDLFGYKAQSMDVEGYGRYVLLTLGSHEASPMIAGIGAKGPRMPMAAWGLYVRVANMEEARDRIAELGGQNHTGIMTVPGTGRMSVVQDPTGAFFSIMEPEAM
jgi:predicted enzyme related to lactoylglutathione lyase